MEKRSKYKKGDLLLMRSSYNFGLSDTFYWRIREVKLDDKELTFLECVNLANKEVVDFPLMFADKLFVNFGDRTVNNIKVLYGRKGKDSKN